MDANHTIAADSAPQARSTAPLFSARERWLIAASVLAVSLLFAAIALLSTPMYRSTAMLAPANNDKSMALINSTVGQFGGLASLAGLNLGGSDSSTEEALAVLQSREFGERFIQEHGLMPLIFASQWDAAGQRWKGPADDQPTPGKAFRYFDKRIRRIDRDKKTGLFVLGVVWKDRMLAAQWANDIVKRLNEEMRARAIARSTTFLRYLEKAESDTTVVTTREAIGRLIEAQVKQQMMANVSEEYAFRIVDKALPADADDLAWPPRALLIELGPLLGLALGLCIVFGLPLLRGIRRPGTI